MEHFRILLTQQRDALLNDKEVIKAQIIEKELELDKLHDEQREANSALRSIEKKLGKL